MAVRRTQSRLAEHLWSDFYNLCSTTHRPQHCGTSAVRNTHSAVSLSSIYCGHRQLPLFNHLSLSFLSLFRLKNVPANEGAEEAPMLNHTRYTVHTCYQSVTQIDSVTSLCVLSGWIWILMDVLVCQPSTTHESIRHMYIVLYDQKSYS